MKVLLVEDDVNKSDQIAEFLKQWQDTIELVQAQSFQSAVKALRDLAPEVLLLDMTLPTFDIRKGERGGRIRTYGGRDVLSEVLRQGITTRAFVLTQFESFGEGHERRTLSELSSELEAEFPGIYYGTIYYHPSEVDWKGKLRNVLHLIHK
jgi:CheY-like chemotaxis protein